jgi:Ras family protein U
MHATASIFFLFVSFHLAFIWLVSVHNSSPEFYQKPLHLCEWILRCIELQFPCFSLQDDFDPLRSLCYPDSDVFLLCFSVINPTSFQNISEKWLPEIRRFCPEAPLILVGTQSDRRRDVRQLQELARYGQAPVPEIQARCLARHINAAMYVETSALTQRDLKEAFDQAIVTALSHRGTVLVNTKQNSKFRHKNGKKRQSLWQKLCCFS